MDPQKDFSGWPHAEWSRIVPCRPHRWHVQDRGQGKTLLFLHGAGASTHSWRDILPAFLDRYRVVAIDLPGHGFTQLGARQRSSLDAMATDLAVLLESEGIEPAAIVGHSAGAAIALRLASLSGNPPVIGLNAALQPFHGLAAFLFPLAARVLAMTPFAVTGIVRSLSSDRRISALLAETGSVIDAEGAAYYARLCRDHDHVDGTLRMMAQWSLDGLLSDLPAFSMTCLLLTGEQDGTVPPTVSVAAAAQMQNAVSESFDRLGHLMHEEAPARISARLRAWLDDAI
ncbi:alpha/beta fold hydrolase [Thalassococcus sp. CAU 1522]|uniref:Alpha/beta fold hydrolase n=1 Tax=Thalassococcus arenae TaxID=2851652 RepID=A0ABS6N5W3_9RHOB|nr:alpha/beta fold hydrolase BchO [Thalassococcus arenae]MBV2359399.1 alpha/beta fold hydrolase [Thalassococcus arenae]